jgi:hypothetical protein
MKKRTISITVAAIAIAFSVVSCTKDRVCKCTYSSSANSNTSTDETQLIGVTKGQAKANCVSTSWTDKAGTTYKSDCELQ